MTTATDMLAAYLQAEAAILTGKEFRWADGRLLRREDLAEIRAGRQEWEAKAAGEAAHASGAPTFGGRGFAVADLSGGNYRE